MKEEFDFTRKGAFEIEDKYKIFKVYIKQSFDYSCFEYSRFKKIWRIDRQTSYNLKEHYILAVNNEDAVKEYKRRYKWEYDFPLDGMWDYTGFGRYEKGYISDIPNWEHEVKGHEVHPTLDTLKKELRAEEFFTYCRQEMYPVEVIIK